MRTRRSGPPEFREELVELMQEAVALEKGFIRDCLPVEAVGLSADEFERYIDYIADQRLSGVGLAPLSAGPSPLPWLAEMMDIRKEQNFFEGSVTEYQKRPPWRSSRRRPVSRVDQPNRRDTVVLIDFAEILQDLELKRAAALPPEERPLRSTCAPRSATSSWATWTCGCAARTATSGRSPRRSPDHGGRRAVDAHVRPRRARSPTAARTARWCGGHLRVVDRLRGWRATGGPRDGDRARPSSLVEAALIASSEFEVARRW